MMILEKINMEKIQNIVSKMAKALIVGVLLLGTQSCESVLEEKVISQIGNDYINSFAGVNDAVEAGYSAMRAWYGTERGNNLTIFGTDTYMNGADGSWKFMNTYEAQFDPRTGQLQELWDEFYRGINTCNAVLERGPKVTGLTATDAATLKIRLAEAKFLRAHMYFILVQTFGGIDLRITETIEPTKVAKRATEAEVYAQIVKDLTEAVPDLENRARSAQYGRATRAVAEHLLAMVYLTKGTSSAKAADDFAKAEAAASNVIKNYGITLLPDFAQVHAEGNEANAEVIWGIQYTYDPLTNGGGNNAHVFFLMEYDTQAGMQRDTQNGRPFKRYVATNYTFNTIFAIPNRVNDSRYSKTFLGAYITNRPGTFNTTFDRSKPSITLAAGDTAFAIPGFEMPLAERARRKYQVLTPSMYTLALFPSLRKHIDGRRADRTVFEGGRDYIAFRLAETYLMLAEAQIRQGKAADAAANINVVRRRAAWPGRQKEMEITAAQATMDFIMEERERELIGEQRRWFDLKRWGNLVERVKAHNPQAAPNIKDFHVLRPIPQVQIDRVEGGATAFPQNAGY
jgi:starch-binding outer membrane protein, SusD/RagB family